MKTYIVKLNAEYSVKAENEEEVLDVLGEKFAIENTTAENEFWDNCEWEEEDELKSIVKEKISKIKGKK